MKAITTGLLTRSSGNTTPFIILPGAGNVMIFDNGASSGDGAPGALTAAGSGIHARATSRVLGNFHVE